MYRLLTKAHRITSDKGVVILCRLLDSHKTDLVQRRQRYVEEERVALILIPAARILSMSPHHHASARDLWAGVRCDCRCTPSAAAPPPHTTSTTQREREEEEEETVLSGVLLSCKCTAEEARGEKRGGTSTLQFITPDRTAVRLYNLLLSPPSPPLSLSPSLLL